MLTPEQIQAIKDDTTTATPQEIVELCDMCLQASGEPGDDATAGGAPTPPADPRAYVGGGGSYGRGNG